MSKSLKRLGLASTAAVVTVFVAMTPVMATGGSDHGNAGQGQHQQAAKGEQAKSEGQARAADKSSAKKSNSGPGTAKRHDGGNEARTQGQSNGHGKGQSNGHTQGTGNAEGNEGQGHTPVTVCHRLGNGSYNVLTFDDNALPAHQGHGDIYPVPSGGCPTTAAGGGAEGPDGPEGNEGQGHTPVTVCHVLGNGGYNVLTFDQHALKAHVGHGDLYPVPAQGCPAGAGGPGTGGPGTVVPDAPITTECPTGDLNGTEVEGCGAPSVPGTAVLGAEAEATTAGAKTAPTADVLGVEASANRAPADVSRMSGILPATGAGQVGLIAFAGLLLFAAGGALLARRRPQSSR